MLTKPDLAQQKIIEELQRRHDPSVTRIEFLPLGADVNTAVYRVAAASMSYFLKLRRGEFSELAVAVPAFLHAQGIQ